jgi:DNA invertase Pin-like site-specific DNA recombinase
VPIPTPSKKRAIAYVRFSSDKQKDGSSVERQTETITEYAKRHYLDLVETFTDEGFSASSGKHVSHGKLGTVLLPAVDAGKYRGFVLIVEKADRLTREGMRAYSKLVERFFIGGVELHFAATGRIVGSEDDLASVILGAVESYGAKQYTDIMKLHVRKGKESKKDKAAAGGWILSRKIPYWLKIVGRVYDAQKIANPGRFEVIEDRAQVVREVFRLAAQGVGAPNIVRKLNGSLEMGGKLIWVTRTLRERSVLGEFTPAGREPIAGYFPQVITHEEWNAAQAQIDLRRAAWGKSGNQTFSDQANNLFAGLVYDASSERPMNIVTVKTPNRKYTYLRTNVQNGEKRSRVAYDVFEYAILQFLSQEDWQAVAGSTESEECKAAKDELEVALREIDKLNRRIESANAAMDDETDIATIKVLASRVAKDEFALAGLGERKELLQDNVEMACNKCASLYEPQVLIDLIQSNAPEANDIRLRLRSELRKRISRIDIAFGKDGQADEGFTLITIEYINGVMHQIGMKKGDSRVVLLPDIRPGEDISERVRE